MITEKSIFSKLEYSARLQRAYLPKQRHFDRIFKESFVIYHPAEYLSGDFFWVGKNGDLKYAAVGDATGHGVSAAFLSMLGYNFLNYALHNKQLLWPDDILKELDKQLIEAFSSVNEEAYDNDWIDISIICYNSKTRELLFSGANRKVLIVDGNSSKVLKGSKYPVGGWQLEESRNFEVQHLILEKESALYLGSDGFQDQFNEEWTKKMGSRRLHELINSVAAQPMNAQKGVLEQHLFNWMGEGEQTDDICVVGLKV